MRWVVAQPGASFSVHDVYAGWVEALRGLGEHVVEFNLDERFSFYGSAEVAGKKLTAEQANDLALNGIYATLYKLRPDVLMVVSGFFIPPDVYRMARSYGTKIVVVHTEQPYELQRELRLAELADINLINDPTHLTQFPAGTRYVPHAYRPSVHLPGPAVPAMESELAFVGTGYPSRIAFLEAMDLDGVDVLLAGNWAPLSDESPLWKYLATDAEDCLDNEQTVDVYRSAQVGLNLYRREAETPSQSVGWAMGPREVEMAACGLFFLRDPRPEGDELLPMLPTFYSPAEASEQLRWWLAHPVERERAASEARLAVADRTFHKHAVDLLRLIEKE